MKKLMLAVLAGAALGVTGCVSSKVTDQNPGKMPAYRDRVESRYERPLNEVFEATKRALNSYGNITEEGSLFAGTNQVRTIAGSINQRGVWMRLEGLAPSVTSVTIQIRAKLGGTDLRMAHELEDRIKLELAH
jgi:hypothetical protein